MSTSSPELFVELDRSRPRGLRAQLERGLRTAIRTGRLRPGVQLPSSRALAEDLRITRGVVVAAYHQLAAEGYLTSRQGSGTVVNVITAPEGTPRADAPQVRVRYDFRPGAPDVGLFPHAAWARATRTAL
jgi:GntR family transcriptional regulator/MocR family aminotransferase